MQHSVTVYTPIEAALFLNGGWAIVLAFIVAALVGAGVFSLIERYTGCWQLRRRYDRPRTFKQMIARHNGKISIATGMLTLYLIHLANVKGWLF
jgi:hypothetical protein